MAGADKIGEATDQITGQITGVQQQVHAAAQAITRVTERMGELKQCSQTIAVSVEQQSSAVQEISANASDASQRVDGLAGRVETVRSGMKTAESATQEAGDAAQEITRQIAHMRTCVENLLEAVQQNSGQGRGRRPRRAA